MSTHEWKPGDVALVRNEWDVWNVAICTLRADRLGYWWRYGVADSWSPIVAEARPLVVIDPEGREVNRLVKILGTHVRCSMADMREAFRAMVNPPAPEEPTGLGAVVEDHNGDLHVRTERDYAPWIGPNNAAVGPFRPWNDISAVRVLSEGVDPA